MPASPLRPCFSSSTSSSSASRVHNRGLERCGAGACEQAGWSRLTCPTSPKPGFSAATGSREGGQQLLWRPLQSGCFSSASSGSGL